MERDVAEFAHAGDAQRQGRTEAHPGMGRKALREDGFERHLPDEAEKHAHPVRCEMAQNAILGIPEAVAVADLALLRPESLSAAAFRRGQSDVGGGGNGLHGRAANSASRAGFTAVGSGFPSQSASPFALKEAFVDADIHKIPGQRRLQVPGAQILLQVDAAFLGGAFPQGIVETLVPAVEAGTEGQALWMSSPTFFVPAGKAASSREFSMVWYFTRTERWRKRPASLSGSGAESHSREAPRPTGKA